MNIYCDCCENGLYSGKNRSRGASWRITEVVLAKDDGINHSGGTGSRPIGFVGENVVEVRGREELRRLLSLGKCKCLFLK